MANDRVPQVWPVYTLKCYRLIRSFILSVKIAIGLCMFYKFSTDPIIWI